MEPLFSIITPVYNSSETLKACIESIRNQEITNWELILIDDGSTDNSKEICEHYTRIDQRIHAFYKSNGGASSARNIGLGKANGIWITFIDSDDTINPNYFDLYNIEKVDLCVQRWKFGKDKDTLEPLNSGLYEDDNCKLFMQENLHKDIMRSVCAKFLKRDIIRKYNIKFDTNIKLGEDTIFMLGYFRHVHSVSVNNTSFYIYNRSENWNGAKFAFDKKSLKYFYHRLYSVYEDFPYRSQKLIDFLNVFLRDIVIDVHDFYDQLYIDSIPEYLILNKEKMLYPGKIAHLKWFLLRGISILHKF